MMMMTMMQRWACQRRHKQSTVHSIIDIDQNEARTDPRWVLFEIYKKIPFYVIQKSVSELYKVPTYLPYLVDLLPASNILSSSLKMGKQETCKILPGR